MTDRNYQVVIWSSDIGSDERMDFNTLSAAAEDAAAFRGREEYAAVYDRKHSIAYVIFGDIKTPVFTESVEVLQY